MTSVRNVTIKLLVISAALRSTMHKNYSSTLVIALKTAHRSFWVNQSSINHKCCSECPICSNETDSALQCL